MSVNLNVVVHDPTSICEVWVFCVNISQLNRHKIVNLEQRAKTTLEKKYMCINCPRELLHNT